jgi:heme A synthase
MLLRYDRKSASRVLVLGLVALVVASVGGYVVERKLALPESVADPLRGFLHGVAIALLLLGVYQVRRARPGAGPRR